MRWRALPPISPSYVPPSFSLHLPPSSNLPRSLRHNTPHPSLSRDEMISKVASQSTPTPGGHGSNGDSPTYPPRPRSSPLPPLQNALVSFSSSFVRLWFFTEVESPFKHWERLAFSPGQWPSMARAVSPLSKSYCVHSVALDLSGLLDP